MLRKRSKKSLEVSIYDIVLSSKRSLRSTIYFVGYIKAYESNLYIHMYVKNPYTSLQYMAFIGGQQMKCQPNIPAEMEITVSASNYAANCL